MVVVFDVVEEILSRCLVSDLLRWKSVCKSWYSLISSPSFVKIHQKSMCNKKDDIHTTRIAMVGSYHTWRMAGSSHGLVCIHNEYMDRIIVTNPLTGEFRELAQPPDYPGARQNDWRLMGFGYDSSTDDYKVVILTCNYGPDITRVHILSLKSNVWKLFGHVNYSFYDSEPGILFNGALHWVWFDANDITTDKALIVSFDLAKEEFIEIPQPDDTRYVYYKLGLIEGSLCLYKEYDHCEIWVMKNYNGNPSWELLPITDYCEMKNAIHYMLKDDNQHRKTLPPTYYCDDNTHLSTRLEYLSSPIFVQTLLSPYINNNNDNGRPSRTKNNKSIISTGRSNHAKTNKSTVSTGRPSCTNNNESTVITGRPSRTKYNESTVITGRPSRTKNNKSNVTTGKPSHAKTNKSTVKVRRVKEKRETEEEARGLVTNTYKNRSKGEERSLKSFWKKKDRVA